MSDAAKTPDTSDIFAVREAKLKALREQGADPFRANWNQTHTSREAVAAYVDDEEQSPTVSVAGRITVFRLMGKAAFVKILDRDGPIQLYFKRDIVGEEEYKAFKKLDLGDFVGARGKLFKTKTGEITVRVEAYGLVAKSLRALPEKWHGLADTDQKLRQRYLDLIVNPASRQRFVARSKIIATIRRFLDDRGFLEVETPVLQPEAGGAAARPFVTHFNALDCDFYLRIALELHLKRLLIGGFDRVYELGRIFRNEGLSRKHNPEFTMLEVYQAYSDYRGMMELIHSMVQTICTEVIGSTTITNGDGVTIELGGEWREAAYKDLIIEATGDADWFSRSKEEKLAACDRMGIEVDPSLEDFEVTNDVFEKKVEPSLIQPTFVTHLPVELNPLAKTNVADPSVLDVFELCINGQEIAPAYSEQNDPFAQRQAFARQAGEETQNIDEDFLRAMEYGMPPAGGMGVGIDRLVILLTGAASIRETILFPAVRPAARHAEMAEPAATAEEASATNDTAS